MPKVGTNPKPAASTAPLLAVEDLTVSFATEAARVAVVEDVSFEVPAGSTVGLVGESGCGKRVTAMTIRRLLSMPPARLEAGRVLLRSEERRGVQESVVTCSSRGSHFTIKTNTQHTYMIKLKKNA